MARQLHGTNYIPPDLEAKFTGRAKYAEDYRADGMLFAKLLLSPMPHARIRSIDTSEALAMPGVEAVITADDVPGAKNPETGEPSTLNETALTAEALYEGQPIAAVAAVDELTAADAVEKIKVDFEPLEFCLDPIESLRPNGPNARVDGNILTREEVEGQRPVPKVGTLKWTDDDFRNAQPDQLPMGESEDEWVVGDIDQGFAEADGVIIDDTITHQSCTHHPMEPRTCMAYWRGDKVYIHGSTQSVAITHSVLAGMLQTPRDNIVLHCAYTGGGFGSKIAGTVNMAIPAILAKKTGKPVMQRVTRYEETYYGRARTGMTSRLRMGFRKDGRITAIDLFVVQDNGPYGRQGDARSAGNIASLSYQPMNMRHRTVSVFTNTPPRSAQRAPGGSQITSAIEPILDRAAKQLGIDRLEMRRINAPDIDSKFGGRQQGLTSANVVEAIDQMKELVNWDEKKQLSGRRQGSKVTGVGVALSSYIGGTSGYDGLMVLRPDGVLSIHSGVGNLGTHSYADTSRTACEVLDYPWEKVEMIWGDTSKGLPHTAVQAGSMTTFSETRALHATANDMKKKLQEIAAAKLGGSASSYRVGNERVSGSAGTLTFAQAAQAAIDMGGLYSGDEVAENLNDMTKAAIGVLRGQGLIGAAKDEYPHEGNVYSFVVGYAEVEIDVETGQMRIADYAATTDCGKVMNPRSLVAQLHGGSVQGFGMALGQKWVYDPQWGVPFAHRFYTARPPGILDVPLEMKGTYVDIPDPQTPVGCKGIGEPPVGAGQGAVLCAIQDAMGDAIFQRTPVMTDTIINTLEGLPQPVGALTAHA